ncbi:MAG: ribosome biogenesis GTPase Der [Chlamydiae bacterium]|nr:ribosome biogenesis GTPase Der [Chlamydiota bacterium]
MEKNSVQGIKIAIIGRPNVGKSALFNRIVGRRQAIVDDAEGITRDRGYAITNFFGTTLQFIDTGGIARDKTLPFRESVKKQAEIAMKEADAIIFVIDHRVGVTKSDEEVAHILHTLKKPVFVALNKVDIEQRSLDLTEFYTLGFDQHFTVSAVHGHFITEMVQAIVDRFPTLPSIIETVKATRVAVIGKPNAGKSTLINTLLGDERVVVSEIPGTTLDSVDVEVTWKERPYIFVDTAGLRRKHKENEVCDKFSRIRTEQAIERADICILVLDSAAGLTSQEKSFLSLIEKEGKSCILFFNKWDLVKGFRMEHSVAAIKKEHPFVAHCPIIFGSAKFGKNVNALFPAVQEIEEARSLTLTTGQLNRFLERAVQRVHPPMLDGKRLRIYYMTQIKNAPPTFTLFVNFRSLLFPAYERYLLTQLRKTFPLTGTPIRFEFRQKSKRKMLGVTLD